MRGDGGREIASGPDAYVPPRLVGADGYAAAAAEVERRRGAILAAAGALMDRREPALLLRLARLIVLAGAGTPAQLHACKLLFKLSKLEANDGDFRAAGTLSLLLATTRRARGRAPLALDAALYAAGALKNVSADGANQRALAKESVVAALAPLLRPSSWADANGAATSGDGDDGVAALPPRAVQLLVLTTATLRNVAVSGAVPQFVASGAVGALCELLGAAAWHRELSLNVSRVLAKLSLSDAALAQIDAAAHTDAIVRALREHDTHLPVLIRLSFVLANLAAASEPHQRAVARKAGTHLLRLLDAHVDAAAARAAAAAAATAAEEAAGGAVGGAAEAAGDALAGDSLDAVVKLIRLVAHLSICPEVGARMATAPEVGCLLKLLESFTMEGAHEELLLNTVSAITNLTYYVVDGSTLLEQPARLAGLLVDVLAMPNEEGVVEACRALGNLSRLPDARATVCELRVHEALLMLLSHSSPLVIEAASGALINLAADPEHGRAALLGAGGAAMLAETLAVLLADAPAVARPGPAALMAAKTMCNLVCVGAAADVGLPPAAAAALLPFLRAAAAAARRRRRPTTTVARRRASGRRWRRSSRTRSRSARRPTPARTRWCRSREARRTRSNYVISH